ncbi:valine--tRNA ligase-like isoform X1 [Lytechinus variegatus]|uniref:valine--tRNA ligase-like isoform X1 n=2 Tax=Lytechinus variegatus TaxID=7654 RepID=UPI001BB27586|nr:valine--tRNA ligase-like isoform X1 [Lytechinus variegatus]
MYSSPLVNYQNATMLLQRGIRQWYIPLKNSSALWLVHIQRGRCFISYRQVHIPSSTRFLGTQRLVTRRGLHISQIESTSDGRHPSAGVHESSRGAGDGQRAKAEKRRRRRERIDEIQIDGEKAPGSRRQGLKSWSKKEIVTYDIPTPPGEKKDVSLDLPRSYSPRYVEACWYEWWERMGFFKPESLARWRKVEKENEPFVMCLPPPNVTGVLHLGHTLTATIQDSLIRWKRMVGVPSLWIPGCDHAGIATQVVVEKQLQHEKGLTRHDIGREEFLKEVWKWKEEKGGEIYLQLKQLGSSLDWDRENFTMDQKFSYAVREAFIRLHDEGIIYRSSQLVNWSCTLISAISDIEVDQMSLPGRSLVKVPGYTDPVEFGVLTYFAYPMEGSPDADIVVATTRPETMLGDTGIAVHPHDDRYSHLIGRSAVHPFTGRRLKVIADEAVDMAYGTGAVKITPSHDYNDCEMGRKHDLDFVNVIDEEGNIIAEGTEFQGMKRFIARQAVIQALKDRGLYRRTEDNPMSLPICSRSGDIVEPLLKSQWFVNCAEMGQQALRSVKTGELEIIPPAYQNTWDHWLLNIRDWCISRQLWWGHRIPAYHVEIQGSDQASLKESDSWVSSHSKEEARDKASRKFGVDGCHITLTQDEDVLDTWFSSALFPFAVHGWPHETPDLETYYPSTVLETGYDILFFWVARMVMMGQQLTGQLPFKKVYLHSMVRDAHGRKMSKSLGNVIDPLDVIHGVSLEQLQSRLLHGNLKLDPKELKVALKGQRSDFPQGIPECGTDALRFALASYNSQGQDINLNVDQVLEYRHFCNKIWNASRFALSAFGNDFSPQPLNEVLHSANQVDQWILHKLATTVQACHKGFNDVDLPVVTTALYRLWVHNLCDVYLECIKEPLRECSADERTATLNVLHSVLDGALRLIHPIMPFLTEELFQRLPRQQSYTYPSICVAPYPTLQEFPFINEVVEGQVEVMLEVVHAVRSLEGMLGLKRGQSNVGVACQDEGVFSILSTLHQPLATLTRSSHVEITSNEAPPPGSATLAIGSKCTAYLHLQEASSSAAVDRLQARKVKAENQLSKLMTAMSIPLYEQKVPDHIQLNNRNKVEELEAELRSYKNLLASLQTIAR